jgi:hypothetical protein
LLCLSGAWPRWTIWSDRHLFPILTTQFRVTPIVGLVSNLADFVADPREVDAIFEVPFAFFMDPANHQRHSRDYNGQTRYYYAMPYGDHYVWGATAGMLRALYLRVFG